MKNFIQRIFNREEKIRWIDVSMSRFGTFVPMIDWDELEEAQTDIPVEVYNSLPLGYKPVEHETDIL